MRYETLKADHTLYDKDIVLFNKENNKIAMLHFWQYFFDVYVLHTRSVLRCQREQIYQTGHLMREKYLFIVNKYSTLKPEIIVVYIII